MVPLLVGVNCIVVVMFLMNRFARLYPLPPMTSSSRVCLTCHAGWVLKDAVTQFPLGNGGAGGGSGRAHAIIVDVGSVMVHAGESYPAVPNYRKL